MFVLKNSLVLIIGGAAGIGFETARLCAQHGARIVLTDINEAQRRPLLARPVSGLPPRWRTFLGAMALGMALACPAASASACGYDDPGSVAVGLLNFAYPQALHVGTAVWQLQVDGELPRADPASPTHDESHDHQLAVWEVLRMTQRLGQALQVGGESPPLAMVFVDSGLWTRYSRQDGNVTVLNHQVGAEPGDVVLVTAPVVLRALLDGRMSVARAFAVGAVRLYGDAEIVRAARGALTSLVLPAPST